MEKKEDAKQEAVDAYHELIEWGEDGKVSISDIAARIGKSENTVRTYFKEMEGEFEFISGGHGKGNKTTVRKL
jgi:AraC-like DNA-binding protein